MNNEETQAGQVSHEVPCSDDPYADGVEAAYAGKSDVDNPYDLATNEDAHLSWNDGYNSVAEAEDE